MKRTISVMLGKGDNGSLRRDRFVFSSVKANPSKVSPQFFSMLTVLRNVRFYFIG